MHVGAACNERRHNPMGSHHAIQRIAVTTHVAQGIAASCTHLCLFMAQQPTELANNACLPTPLVQSAPRLLGAIMLAAFDSVLEGF